MNFVNFLILSALTLFGQHFYKKPTLKISINIDIFTLFVSFLFDICLVAMGQLGLFVYKAKKVERVPVHFFKQLSDEFLMRRVSFYQY